MLEITDLDAYYGESHILQGVNLSVQTGEVVTLVGRNGAGKTTLLKSIIGDIPRRTGSIRFIGTEIIDLSPERICKMRVCFVPEDRGIFSTLNVYENLTIGRANGDTAWPLDRIYEYFPILKTRRSQKAASLSGGEKQMLAIARPLYMGASFLMLDEPTEGLAPVVVDAIGALIKDIKSTGLTILLVEQNLQFAAEVADRYYVIENGKIVREMTNHQMAEDQQSLLDHLGV
ncbi:ABC transporter ATP-binding protein [Mesorhizobium sp. M7A.F.Ca.CA.001.09.2.1]|uniref:ABC transporter ATP-binding protein n=1 Tax=Mesorhizobium ciceri TaxID=39645 RepID=A0AB38TJ78_9HYPH|nr:MULTISPECIES: ABC transporter ATP-binding protein [Mesorhizobium]RUY59495.1 ABC transporter ATP-binding protein [Mesorhizobium sp. M7A.F.Ca.CA.001.13.2.1]MDF3212214.1 ABC transporter ATP-binding protein [Mesorhizobium ciceri]RUY70917.1 ABC transporter ATP-binding protein [Mesorhizobium sp. M7A.F.Ca.CA.001.05.1.1]RUY72921.1 ABC transporter ATP-binding protein [Mesorhizobium sp. M7A.F.Ca.CA.001.13.1.1]RUY79741.1 ABC transporter ATP-binding protein [Mesorhizobium sp. M7A.F.Ca.CA.001.09.2.1]